MKPNYFVKKIRQVILRFKRRMIRLKFSMKFPGLVIRKNTSDWKAFKQVMLARDYDFPINFEPKLIIDGGANAGYASLFFVSKFPKAKIFAIEPEESNFQVLKQNTKNFEQITAIKAGLWPKSGYLKVRDTGQGKWGFATEEAGPLDYDVKTITIDEILKQSECREIGILKLDIEGSEYELFSENYESWLNKVKVLIIELHDRMRAGAGEAFYSAVKKYNFHQTARGENIILTRT